MLLVYLPSACAASLLLLPPLLSAGAFAAAPFCRAAFATDPFCCRFCFAPAAAFVELLCFAAASACAASDFASASAAAAFAAIVHAVALQLLLFAFCCCLWFCFCCLQVMLCPSTLADVAVFVLKSTWGGGGAHDGLVVEQRNWHPKGLGSIPKEG